MKITIGEYCQFSVQARVQLLHSFGQYICFTIIERKGIILFKLFDFYVEVIKDLYNHTILQANPIPCNSMITFYKKISFF